MNRFVIATGSITQALKGKEVLLKNRYPAEIERMKYGTENFGCGYGIVTAGRMDDAERLLKNNDVRIYKIMPID